MNNPTRRYEVPHKCIQVSEEGFLGSTYSKTGKVITTAAVRYLLHAPLNVQVWPKAFFWWVRAKGWSPHASGMAKNTFGSVGFPLLGAPGNKSNRTKGWKSLGGGRPPEAGGNLQLPRHIRPDPCQQQARPVEVRPNNWRSAVLIQLLRYLLTAPPNGQVWHKAFFMVGPDAGP